MGSYGTVTACTIGVDSDGYTSGAVVVEMVNERDAVKLWNGLNGERKQHMAIQTELVLTEMEIKGDGDEGFMYRQPLVVSEKKSKDETMKKDRKKVDGKNVKNLRKKTSVKVDGKRKKFAQNKRPRNRAAGKSRKGTRQRRVKRA